MGTIREWTRRLWGSLRRHQADAELEEELLVHLDFARQHSLAAGSSERCCSA